MATNVTLEEVARLAGVSTSTVSRYLSGTHAVSAEKKKAIDDCIQQLNYRPNLVARGLAKGRSMTVGVMTQEILSSFFNEAMRGVEDGLIGHNYEAIFVSGHWDPADEARRLSSLLGRGVDGVVLIMSGLSDDVLERHANGMPTVLMGGHTKARHVHAIALDHYEGACRAVRHLLELGHQRIAFIGGPADRLDADARHQAYRDTLAQAGIPYDDQLVASGNYVAPGGVTAMNILLDRGRAFTGVFAANDDSAYGAMLALHRRGIVVPRDVSLVGYDDLPHSSYCIPPLTSVHQPLRELGREAANAIVALIEGRRPPRSTLTRLDLIVRESSRALPA